MSKRQTESMNPETQDSMNPESENAEVEMPNFSEEFNIDPELLSGQFNVPRMPRFPYGIVVNDNPAGLFIPAKNLLKAGWMGTDEFINFELPGAVESGLFFQRVRMVILGSVPPYIRYKNDKKLGELSQLVVGFYEERKHELEKKVMNVVSEHAILLLNEANQPLHSRPLSIRFKNVALWSLKEALDEFYQMCEFIFSKLTQTKPASKSNRWRSLCVFNVEFQAVKEGEGGHKSWCCKVGQFQIPTFQNFPELFLGKVEQKTQIWEVRDLYAIESFTESLLLPGKPIESVMVEETPRQPIIIPPKA